MGLEFTNAVLKAYNSYLMGNIYNKNKVNIV